MDFFYFLNSFAGKSELLDFLIYFCANILPALYIVFLFAYFSRGVVASGDDKRPATGAILNDLFFIIFAGVFSALAVYGAKLLFAVPRPFLMFQDIHALFAVDNLNSFPSMHAAVITALAVASVLHGRKLLPLSISMVVLVCIARIIAGVHTPIDILGGIVLGATIACLLYSIKVFHNRGQDAIPL